MILDAMLLFSKEQSITVDAASTNVIDLGAEGDAVGQELTLSVICTHAFAGTSLGSGTTLQMKLQTNSTGSGTFDDVVLSPQVVLSNVKSGGVMFKVRVPQGLQRYVRMYYDVTPASGATISSGAVTAFMHKEL